MTPEDARNIGETMRLLAIQRPDLMDRVTPAELAILAAEQLEVVRKRQEIPAAFREAFDE